MCTKRFEISLALTLAAVAGCRHEQSPRGPTPTIAPCPLTVRGLTTSTPEAEGLDPSRIRALVEHARAERSSAIVILANGRLVLQETFGGPPRPIAAMSATKSIVALAVMHLVDQKALSLDTRVSELLPSWRRQAGDADEALARVTVRQLMNHTSGIETEQAHTWEGETLTTRAASTKLVAPPGARFTYNNNAVDMLALVVAAAAHQRLDDYLQRHIFGPLEISGAYWDKDHDGHPRAAGELVIHPVDLAKLGQLVLDRGTWRGTRILSEASIDALLAQGQPINQTCGLLFWREGEVAYTLNQTLFDTWRGGGVDPSWVDKIAHGLDGRSFSDVPSLVDAERALLSPTELDRLWKVLGDGSKIPFAQTVLRGNVTGYSARGSFGQYIVVDPAHHVVAVRMRELAPADFAKRDYVTFSYAAFRKEALELAVRPRAIGEASRAGGGVASANDRVTDVRASME